MTVYVYQGDLYCEPCANEIKALLSMMVCPRNIDNENTYTSDEWPKGPYPNDRDSTSHECYCGNERCCKPLNGPDTKEIA